MIVSCYPLFLLQQQENVENFCPNDPTPVHFRTNIIDRYWSVSRYLEHLFDFKETFREFLENISAILRDICEKACAELQSLLVTVPCIDIRLSKKVQK